MNTTPRSWVIPLASFLVAVLLSLLAGPQSKVLARPPGSTTADPTLKITHLEARVDGEGKVFVDSTIATTNVEEAKLTYSFTLYDKNGQILVVKQGNKASTTPVREVKKHPKGNVITENFGVKFPTVDSNTGVPSAVAGVQVTLSAESTKPTGASDTKSAEDGPTPGLVRPTDNDGLDVTAGAPVIARAGGTTSITYSGTAKAKAGDTATPPFTGTIQIVTTFQNAGGTNIGPALNHTIVDVSSTNPGQWNGTVIALTPAGVSKVTVQVFVQAVDSSPTPKSGSATVNATQP